jgi:hypothetical protein
VDLEASAAKCKGTAGTTNQKSIKYSLKQATLTSVGASVTAQDVVVTENLGFMFLDLDYTATG